MRDSVLRRPPAAILNANVTLRLIGDPSSTYIYHGETAKALYIRIDQLAFLNELTVNAPLSVAINQKQFHPLFNVIATFK